MVTLAPLGDARAGIFFDLEKTFCADAVEQVAALAMWRRGQFRTRDIARVLWCYARYNLGFIEDFETLKAEGAQVFAGRSLAEDRCTYAALYRERLRPRVHREAIAVAEQGSALGYYLAFVSSTYRFMVDPFAEEFGFDDRFGCLLEAEGDTCTGALRGAIYHQERKAVCVRELAEANGLDLSRSYAFGDSVNDVAMLSAVGNPFAVNPSRGLRQEAESRGWPIVGWEPARREGAS